MGCSLLSVEEVEQLQPLLAGSKGRPGSETRLGVELGQGDGGELVDQLVHTDLAPLGKLAEALVLLVGQTDRQGGHSNLLHEFFGRQDQQARELELSALEIPDVLRDQDRGSASDGQLDQMVVRLVSQVGAPAIVDRRPAADAEIGIEEVAALPGVEWAFSEERLSREQRLMLCEEGGPHQREQPAVQAGPENLAAGSRRPEKSRYEDVGVQDDDHQRG